LPRRYTADSKLFSTNFHFTLWVTMSLVTATRIFAACDDFQPTKITHEPLPFSAVKVLIFARSFSRLFVDHTPGNPFPVK
jgi:hypothetical protein